MKGDPIRKTFYFVFAIHAAAVILCLLQPNPREKKKPLHVKTFTAVPPAKHKPQPHTAAMQAQPAKKVVQPASLQIEKKQPSISKPKPAAQKAAVQAKKTVSKNAKPQSNVSHLLKELEETVDKIDEKRDKIYQNKLKDRKNDPVPESITALKIDTINEIDNDESQGDFSYQERLVCCLKETLDLPEFGQVKIELTLTVSGDVMKLRVLASESEKNKSYLEKNLRQMKFPSFGGSEMENKRTFILTFCNEL